MSRSDLDYALEAAEHFDAIQRHITRTDLDDETDADAVSSRLAAAIESLSHLSAPVRSTAFGQTWTLMWATRNRIAHGYAFVNRAVIQHTVDVELPEIVAIVRRLAKDLQPH